MTSTLRLEALLKILKKKIVKIDSIVSRQQFLTKHRIVQVQEASYLPDRALCEYFLFPKLTPPKDKVDDVQICRLLILETFLSGVIIFFKRKFSLVW